MQPSNEFPLNLEWPIFNKKAQHTVIKQTRIKKNVFFSIISKYFQNTKQKKIDDTCRLIQTMSQQQLKADSKHTDLNHQENLDDQTDDENDW